MKPIQTKKGIKTTEQKMFLHYFFSVTAILFLIICIIGFSAGISLKSAKGIHMASFRFIAHGFFGFLWVSLYILQTQFVFRKSIQWHMRIGKMSVLAIFLLLISTLYLLFSARNNYPDFPINELAIMAGGLGFNALIIIFLLFLGVVMRKKPFIHKRLMFFGTLFLIGTGIDRLPWAIHGLDDGNMMLVLTTYLLFSLPLIIYDFRTEKSKLKAFSFLIFLYYIIFGLIISMVLTPYVFTTETWIEFVDWMSSML